MHVPSHVLKTERGADLRQCSGHRNEFHDGQRETSPLPGPCGEVGEDLYKLIVGINP